MKTSKSKPEVHDPDATPPERPPKSLATPAESVEQLRARVVGLEQLLREPCSVCGKQKLDTP